MCRAELCRVHRTGRGSKINYDSLCLRQIFQRSVNRDIPDLTGFLVHTGNNAAIAAGRDLFHKGMAHTAVNALNNQIRHLNCSFLFQSTGPRRRNKSAVLRAWS